MKKTFKIFSLFSGIGLLDLGFESVGSEVIGFASVKTSLRPDRRLQ